MTDGWGTGNGWVGAVAEEGGPDWAAMAEQHTRELRRRRQLRIVGGAVAGVLVVGGITATAVTMAGGNGGGGGAVAAASGSPVATAAGEAPDGPAAGSAAPSPSASLSAPPGASASASVSASAGRSPSATASGRPGTKASTSAAAATPADPLTAISSAATDTAPLSPAALFPSKLTVDGRSWTRLTTATTDPCWRATTGGLGDVLAAQGCHTLLRATYTSGSSAVTVGVAPLENRTLAAAAAAAHKGQVQGLVTAGSIAYCTDAGCASTHATVGRYAYYTVAGTVKPGGLAQDSVATAAQPGFAAAVRSRLLARGRG